MNTSGDGPVILVDDDEVDIEILTRSFGRSKLSETRELLSFMSGESFLEHMVEVDQEMHAVPSIVLLDINMPRMNGFEVLDELRRYDQFVEVPAVMFVSNTDNPHDIERCRERGAGFQEKFDSMAGSVAFFDGLLPTEHE